MSNLRTITVAELIEKLQNEDPQALVVFTADYGDRSHTEQALPIRGRIEETLVEENAYSNSGFALADDDVDQDDEDHDGQTYLVIR